MVSHGCVYTITERWQYILKFCPLRFTVCMLDAGQDMAGGGGGGVTQEGFVPGWKIVYKHGDFGMKGVLQEVTGKTRETYRPI